MGRKLRQYFPKKIRIFQETCEFNINFLAQKT